MIDFNTLNGENNLICHSRFLPNWLAEELAIWSIKNHQYDLIISSKDLKLNLITQNMNDSCANWIAKDVNDLIAQFVDFTKSKSIRLSFSSIKSDQCRKFHVDYNRYRLITTYLGPGTEYVLNHAVNREALKHPKDCPCDANKEIVLDQKAIQYAKPGEILIMKGALHTNCHGVVHRSPSIEKDNLTRVALILTTIEE